MKKMFALLLAAMMLLAMMPTAMAYTAVTPANDTPTIKHTMTLTKSNTLDYTITYKFSNVNTAAFVVEPTFVTPSLAVTGYPVIANLTYSPSDKFTNKACTKSLEIDWSNVSFFEPGVYRWQFKKEILEKPTEETPSNTSETFYLYAYVIDNNGNLSVDAVIMSASDNPDTFKNNEDGTPSSNKNNGMEDQYPATTLDLTIQKTVTGNQGSKDQYFKFTIDLEVPSGAADKTYEIVVPETISATAYGNTPDKNPQTITTTNGEGTVELWIKHGQSIVIKDLIYGTSYTVVESVNTGYTVTSAIISGDTADAAANGATVSDTGLTSSTTVSYTNEKSTAVPTGIELETAAPIVGMMLAMALLALLFVGKRKEEIA